MSLTKHFPSLRFRRESTKEIEGRLARLEELVAKRLRSSEPAKPELTLYCNFCGKSQHDVHDLIAGPACFICNECVVLCVEILCEPDRKGGAA